MRDTLNLDVAAGSDIHGAAQRFRKFTEDLRHLHSALKVKLVGLELHAIGIAHGLAGLDAEQHFLGMSVVVMEVMAIVGGDERDTGLFRKPDQLAIDIFFDWQSLILNFEKKIAFAKYVAQAVSIFARLIIFLVHNGFRHRATKAGRESNQAFVVFGKQVVVNARFVVEAFKEACGNQFN